MYRPRLEVLIDREAEQHDPQRLLRVGAPQLALLTGRRRVGKTLLLTHGWGTGPHFLFTAVRTMGEINRRQSPREPVPPCSRP